MARGFFAWDLTRNLMVKCSLFCTKFILKNLYLAENSLYKKPLFLREPTRGGPAPCFMVLFMSGFIIELNIQCSLCCLVMWELMFLLSCCRFQFISLRLLVQ